MNFIFPPKTVKPGTDLTINLDLVKAISTNIYNPHDEYRIYFDNLIWEFYHKEDMQSAYEDILKDLKGENLCKQPLT